MAEKKIKKAELQELKEKIVPIIWGSADDLSALYANHFYVTHAGEIEFHIIFGHLTPPLTIGMTEDQLPSSIKIKPVAKVVLTPEAMKAFVQLLNDNLEKYEVKQKEEKNG
jgi:hypothetical protein